MKLLTCWLLIINVIGICLMYIDKKRARTHRWRISERALIFTAVIGGSLGILAGMYLFRHKTRHLKFTIGVPVILAAQLAGAWFFSQRYAAQTPQAVLTSGLNALTASSESQDDSSDAILALLSEITTSDSSVSTDIPPSSGSSDTAPTDEQLAAQTAALFYQHFQYEIKQISIEGNTACADVTITAVDAAGLARDLCLSLTQQKLISSDASDFPSNHEILSLILHTLQTNSYALNTNDYRIYLTKSAGIWYIDKDDAYLDAVLGGLINSIRDPWLLDADDVLTVYLDYYQTLNAQQWYDLFQTEDLFGTGSPSLAKELDMLYCETLSSLFKAQITDCVVEDNQADVSVLVTSIDMPSLVSQCHEEIVTYAQSAPSVTSDSEALSDAVASCLISGLKTYAEAADIQIDILIKHDSSGWYPVISQEVIQSFMGNMDEAVSIMQSW